MKRNYAILSLAEVKSRVAAQRLPVYSHSGKVIPGAVFVALPKAVPAGVKGPDYSDAGKYAASAIRSGAAYLVCTPLVLDDVLALLGGALQSPQLAVILVDDSRKALGELASALYGTAALPLKLLGITGTNGKTTSSYLLEALFRAVGRVPGVIGTVEYRWPGYEEASPLTTPDCLSLHAMLAAMSRSGADTALMEVSSHAIEQDRIAGLHFAGALFTNLSQDHLDYHKDMEEYFSVKARLFHEAPKGAALAVNVDDPYGARLFKSLGTAIGYSFGSTGESILSGELLEQGQEGLLLRMRFNGQEWVLRSPLVGAFNAANLLGVQALALALGFSPDSFQALSGFGGVPGRLERIVNDRKLSVFVDYAHTPDALEKALSALRGAGFSRIITVFGCGGNRDRGKRPLMGEVAARLSELVVLTSDNPREEDPLAIMADIRPGLSGAKEIIEEANRAKAIALALERLRPGDALLIAGKGHESYQIIGDTKYPFSDQQIAREYMGCA